MQEYWAESQMGPFPESIQNTIVDLWVSFEKRDMETTSNPSPASITTTAIILTPTNTATSATYETTTATTTAHTDTAIPTTISETAATLEQLDQALDIWHVTPIPAWSEVELTTTTMAMDLNSTQMKIEQWYNVELTENKEVKWQRRAEEWDRAREQEAEQPEELDTEEERIEESWDEVWGDLPLPTTCPALEHNNNEEDTCGEPQQEHRGLEDSEDGIFKHKLLKFRENEVQEQGELEHKPAYSNTEVGNGLHKTQECKGCRIQEHNTTCTTSPTAKAAINPAPHEHVWFNWVTNVDISIGPVPSLRDFCLWINHQPDHWQHSTQGEQVAFPHLTHQT